MYNVDITVKTTGDLEIQTNADIAGYRACEEYISRLLFKYLGEVATTSVLDKMKKEITEVLEKLQIPIQTELTSIKVKAI